jgi:hypothetical protein
MAGVAWLYLASIGAFIRAEGGPDFTAWRNDQWQELRGWALNPTREETINLKYCVPSGALLFSGALVRLFTANLLITGAGGVASFILSFLMMRKYVIEKSALGLEVELGPKGMLVFWTLSFLWMYVFLVILTGALITA